MKFAKPHIYFLATGLVILLLTLIIYKSDDVIDINIHDTYFVIAYSHFGKLFSFIFLFIGLIYFLLLKIKLYEFLTKTHTLISIGSCVIFIIGQIYFKTYSNNSDFPLFDDLSNYNTFSSIILILFILVQFIFLLNLILSITKFIINRRHFKLN